VGTDDHHRAAVDVAVVGYPDQMQWLVRGESQVPQGQQWLTGTEAARASGMRFTKRRTEYLLRRYAGKCAVAAAVGHPGDPVSLGRIAVLNRMTGAPYVEVDGQPLGLDISLTDRAGWSVCLVGPDLGAVGVDLEIVEPRSDGFVRDFLTTAERDVVATAPGTDAHDAAANLIWSAKESALKVLRTGLRADTRTVEVVLEDPSGLSTGAGQWQRLSVASGAGRFPGWWRRDGVFLLTVVAAAGLAEPPQVLPGSADLSQAEPIHSWVNQPLVE
jgi:4'-phosphopantetheinyl transferase